MSQLTSDHNCNGDRSSDDAHVSGDGVESLVEEFIDRWETARAEGRDIDPENLYREHPQLLPAVREQIAALKWMPSPHSGLLVPHSVSLVLCSIFEVTQ
ncbi:MAG: hypothetical protein HQ518_17215 [Rhodopirellula sp.]|nr:hypothetical protein [Rhodopirellula sp.]